MRIGDRVIDLENRSLGIGSITEMRSASRAIVSFGLHHYLVPLSSLAYVEDAERILKMQKEKETELHQEALDRKRIQEEKRGKQVQEELSRRRIQTEQRENQRKLFFDEIRRRFHTDFLCSDFYYCETCADLMQKEEYEKEKFSFVKTWLSENLPHDKNGEIQLPDDEQVAAIAAVNGHIQVVARAGSGKTTTLVTRAFFLLKHCRVLPSELLLLAFNRKAALEIRRRLLSLLHKDAELEVLKEVDRRVRATEKKKRIDRDAIEASAVDAVAVNFNVELPHVMTFHALAYAIVHPVESLLYDGAEGESQGLSRVIQQVIDDHLKLPDAREQIRELMLAHFREEWDCIVEGCYDRSKEEFLQYRRSLPRESLRGDFVKSSGEKIIADFLFEHDIAYKYERNHWWSGINYRPDFTIFKGPESGVVIEYFGLKGDEDYDEMTEKKRGYWATKKDWTLIEFEPVDIARDGRHSFLNRLNKRLKAEGVECIRLSEDEIWHRVKDRAIDRFTTAMVGFIGRCRKQTLSPSVLWAKIESYSPLSDVEAMFLTQAHRLYVAYLDRLAATGEDDFDGLMQRAAEAIDAGHTLFMRKSGDGDLASIRYLCIDEFQDFSDLFYRLLSAIRKQSPGVGLFCVGDDWQAINGFAGSDLRFFENFEQHIGTSHRLYISTNYRSSREIVSVGNSLMSGLGKPATAHKKTDGTVLVSDLNKFVPSLLEKQQHSGDIITPAMLRIISKAFADGHDIVLLCRRNTLPWYINYLDQDGNNSGNLAKYLDLIRSFFPKGLKERVTISTAHKYKGLEKSVVIVLDAVARSYPLVHPDWAFSRILGDNLEKITSEERRLFYVALTRAVETLVIVTEGSNKSTFLECLDRRGSTNSIQWEGYPPVRGLTQRLVVKVCNQANRGNSPTYAIKDLLRATGYQWETIGTPGWAKSFPADGFTVETIKSELWAGSADGIELRIYDDIETLLACYRIETGSWQCVVDQPTAFCAGKKSDEGEECE